MEKKKKIKFEEDIDMMNYDPKLTRVDPTTKFVIIHSTGRVLYIFKKAGTSGVIKRLLADHHIENIGQLRYNQYKDLIILK